MIDMVIATFTVVCGISRERVGCTETRAFLAFANRQRNVRFVLCIYTVPGGTRQHDHVLPPPVVLEVVARELN